MFYSKGLVSGLASVLSMCSLFHLSEMFKCTVLKHLEVYFVFFNGMHTDSHAGDTRWQFAQLNIYKLNPSRLHVMKSGCIKK